MNLSADTFAYLLGLGLSNGQLVELIAKLERDAMADEPVRSAGAQRQKRYRDRQHNGGDATGDVTRDVTEILPQGSKTKVSPTPPSKTQPPNPIQVPPIVPQKLAAKARPKGNFATFWAEYPLRVGRRKAERAYQAALSRCETEDPDAEVLNGLRRCRPLWEPEFIPHPTTWLNRDGWLDQLVPDTPGATGPPRFDLGKFDEERARLAAQYEENAA